MKYGLCGVCQREIQVRKDGRLRAHLARGSRAGRHQTCEGSGAFSARRTVLHGVGQPAWRQSWDGLTPAARFNAHDEWAKVDALYAEWLDMAALEAASPEAIDEARAAFVRAYDDATALAPWEAMAPSEGEDEAA